MIDKQEQAPAHLGDGPRRGVPARARGRRVQNGDGHGALVPRLRIDPGDDERDPFVAGHVVPGEKAG